ncbi:hypothetical protein D9M69_682810 [compost metagenome]
MGAPENDRAATRAITGDADAQGGLADTLQFQRTVFRPLITIEHQDGFVIGPGKSLQDPLARFRLPYQNKIPWLHEPHRWRPVRGIEQAHHQIVRQGVGQELIPHVATSLDGTIDGFALVR